MHATFILVQRMWSDPGIELVRVRNAGGEDGVKLVEGPSGGFFTQSQAHRLAASGGHFEAVVRGGFRPGLGRIHGFPHARDDVGVKGVLHIRRRIRLAPQAAGVRFVFRK